MTHNNSHLPLRRMALPAAMLVLIGAAYAATAQYDNYTYIAANTTLSKSLESDVVIGFTDKTEYEKYMKNLSGDPEASGSSPTVQVVKGADVGSVTVYHNSTVNMSGGKVNLDINATGTSKVTIGGGFIWGSVTCNSHSTLDMRGGKVLGNVYATDRSKVTISGGAIRGSAIGDGLVCSDDSTVVIRGGSFFALFVKDNVRVHVYGTGLRIYRKNIQGTVYEMLSGKLADGTMLQNLSIGLADERPDRHVVLHNLPAGK